MDDQQFGTRDKRGDWSPDKRIEIAPFYRLPWKPLEILAWLRGFLLPWNALFMAVAAVYWFWLTPDIETLKTLAAPWILFLLIRNSFAILVFYGALELRLYFRRAQGADFKYNRRFPGDKRSKSFLFRSQAVDGAIRTFTTGVPIWTAYEVLILWSYANGYGAWSVLGDHPVWLVVFWLIVPIFHELHFYCIHRLIHLPALYRYIHSVHHRYVNPSPWSSLGMHPVEHLLYFSSSLVHLIVPSHPMIALYQLNFSGMAAVVGHIGFDKIVAGTDRALDTHSYTHYLHHKFFEVNYGDGSVPLDKVFGTWHDGTAESNAQMNARLLKRREKMSRRAAG